jgi:phosphoglycolate phosphatase-like HAD superfamily hydrolase
MNLVIFDIDGTLTESVAVDEVCFVQAFQDVLGIEGINTDWLDYTFQTDSGLALEICRKHLGRDPAKGEISRLQSRFVHLLGAAIEGTGQPMRAMAGAAALLQGMTGDARWQVAIATGGWSVSARFKLASAGLPVDAFPWASADDALHRVDILRTALQRAGRHYGQRAFDKAVYIGDGVWDVRAARELGIGFLGIAAGERARKLEQADALCVLPDFSDTVRVVECLEVLARKARHRGNRVDPDQP